MLHAINPLYSLSGLAVGMLVGFTGVGGGSLMTPLLVLVFGIHPSTAVGTDLLYAGLTKISGSAVHSLHGTVDWRVVRRLATGSAPAAGLTLLALLAFRPADRGAASHVITTTLGVALLMTAVTLLFRKWLIAHYGKRLEMATERADRGVHHPPRRHARRAGDDLLGRRGRARRHRAAHALPENADGAHRRLRHRPCRAADADRGRRALVDRFGRFPAAGLAADRLDPRHHDRQPFRRRACRTACCGR